MFRKSGARVIAMLSAADHQSISFLVLFHFHFVIQSFFNEQQTEQSVTTAKFLANNTDELQRKTYDENVPAYDSPNDEFA